VELSIVPRSNPSTFSLVGDPAFQRPHGRLLRERGFSILEVPDEGAVEAAQSLDLAGMILVLRRGVPAALSVLEAVRCARPTLPIIVLAHQPTVSEAVKVMQLGARACQAIAVDAIGGDVVLSPELVDELEQILRGRQAAASPERTRQAVDHGLVGESAPMKAVLRDVALVAATRTTVLILGETGTGKERIAQAIHQSSSRRAASFVAVNCAALSETLLESTLFGHERGAFSGAHCRREGLFKIADGGTLFLDEIGETSAALQAKLLRVLQERQFERVGGTTPISTDVRIVAATNRDLRQMVSERLFRADLFYRLNVMVVHVPALRHRREDIGPLVSHILARLSFQLGIPRPTVGPEVVARLKEYAWPGNVREMENVLERLIVVSQDHPVGLADLPPELREVSTTLGDGGAIVRPADGRPLIPGATFREIERHAILATYDACGQSPSRTAQVLGLSARTVHYRLREYRGETGRRASTAHFPGVTLSTRPA
jgi:DNA-binding NtrC family response regulator